MRPNKLVQIDLGCSRNKAKGYIGIDIDVDSDADIVADINKSGIPLKESSVDTLISKHLLEHMEDPIRFLKEVYRILKDGGQINIEVPHFSSHIAYGVGHRHHFTYKELVQIFREEISCTIIKAEITFYKTFRLFGIKCLANRFPESYERFWTYIFPAENLKLIVRVSKNNE